MQNSESDLAHTQAQEYYGKTLTGTSSLKTSSCTCKESPPPLIANAISLLHEEVVSHYYGCGICIPNALEGLTCLDLGSGAGRDVYILSKLVGPNGKVYGIDMTPEQIAIAEKHKEYHRVKFGYDKSNVVFMKGFIEDLKEIESNSVDLIVSNCVINLCPNKNAVLSEAYRVLKKGGEFYFSDVYSDRRIAKELLSDPVLHGECLSGAFYWYDFLKCAIKNGFTCPRLVNDRKIALDNEEIDKKIGFANFFSATFRLFKIDDLEENEENYGQEVIYKGTIDTDKDQFVLDNANTFPSGKKCKVDGNTFKMLKESRYCKHFEFFGDFCTHYGSFWKNIPFNSAYCCGQKGGCCGEKNDCCC